MKKLRNSFTERSIFYGSIAFLLIVLGFHCFNGTKVKIYKSDESQLMLKINQYRQAKGLPGFTSEERIAEVARRHSADMAEAIVPFGHIGSHRRFEKLSQDGLEWVAVAENIARVPRSGDPLTSVLRSWENIRIYRENMEGEYDLSGIGIAQNKKSGEYYITQIFLKSK